MNENYEYTEYNDERNTIPWKRILLILLFLVVAIVISLFLIKGCGKKSLNDELLKAGKNYYQDNLSALPSEVGQCREVTLEQLIDLDLIKNADKYKTCDYDQTYVKVCYLESKTYHYTPILSCANETSKFGLWSDGIEADIVEDKSDVRFRFLGEQLKSLGTKHYFSINSKESGKEYYAVSPSNEYTLKEGETTGYKWYTNTSGETYWNNGDYSSTQPSGFPNKGASKNVEYYSVTAPVAASYRQITEVQLYRTIPTARPLKYVCHPKGNENTVIESDTPCDPNSSFPELSNIIYTCDGTDRKGEKVFCGEYSEWTTKECKTSLIGGITCEGTKGYKYVDTMWKWYKTGSGIKYYPSGSVTADLEKTYYTSAPVAGAIKDESTKSTVYKYYKIIGDSQTDNIVEDWTEITDGYVFEGELIEAFKELGFDVNSLSDINKLENIRYKLKLQYRNLED